MIKPLHVYVITLFKPPRFFKVLTVRQAYNVSERCFCVGVALLSLLSTSGLVSCWLWLIRKSLGLQAAGPFLGFQEFLTYYHMMLNSCAIYFHPGVYSYSIHGPMDACKKEPQWARMTNTILIYAKLHMLWPHMSCYIICTYIYIYTRVLYNMANHCICT